MFPYTVEADPTPSLAKNSQLLRMESTASFEKSSNEKEPEVPGGQLVCSFPLQWSGGWGIVRYTLTVKSFENINNSI